MLRIIMNRDKFTDMSVKQGVNPWKMKLLAVLTMGTVFHNAYCMWIIGTSNTYIWNNPPELKIFAILANGVEMIYFVFLVVFIHTMGRESFIETLRDDGRHVTKLD